MGEKTKIVDPGDVAEKMGVSRRTVLRMCEDGELPAVRVRGQWRIYLDWEEHLRRETYRRFPGQKGA